MCVVVCLLVYFLTEGVLLDIFKYPTKSKQLMLQKKKKMEKVQNVLLIDLKQILTPKD